LAAGLASPDETLRALSGATRDLLAAHTEWTACRRAASMRSLIAHVQGPAAPAAEAPEAMDLVVPLGTGSAAQDEELRFLLRSARANLVGLRRVHVIGPRRPAWLVDHPQGVWHEWVPQRPKNHDIIAKFLYAARQPGVTEHFVAACDDWAFLRPLRPGVDWGSVRNGGVLSTGKAGWKGQQAETRRVLAAAGFPVRFYDYHVPTVMTKAGWLQVDARVDWRSVPGHAVWSLYHNVAGVHGPVLGGAEVSGGGWHSGEVPASEEEIEQASGAGMFLAYNSAAFNGPMRAWLRRRFPDAEPWEGEAVAPAAGGVTGAPAADAAVGRLLGFARPVRSLALAAPLRTPQPVAAARRPAGMVAPAEQKIIQVLITDACPRRCSNCTQLVGHRREPVWMDEATFQRAVGSLDAYPGMLGVMGGEPTLHPQFAEFSRHLAARRPDPAPGLEQYDAAVDWAGAMHERLRWHPWRKGLWTGLGPGYRRHYELIQATYRYQCVNDHRGGGRHLALLLPRQDLGVPDAEWRRYRDACWLQRRWSAMVTPRGAYFCEVAAALARTFGGPDGWPIEPEWWRRTPAEFGAQLEMCELCSACLPVPSRLDADDTDQVTAAMAERLRAAGSRKAMEVIPAKWAKLRAAHRVVDHDAPYMADGDGSRVHAPTGLEVGALIGVVTCRGYDDYLDLTLARTVGELGRVVVAASAGDAATAAVARRHGAEVFLAPALAGAEFRKGAAIAQALATLPAAAWVAVLDADIVLPRGWGERVRSLTANPGALYYTERFGPPLEDWRAARPIARMALGGEDWDAIRETIGDRIYSQAHPWGYCQVFHLASSAIAARPTRYPVGSASAAHDDSALAKDWFGLDRCRRLPGDAMAVLHLPHGVSRTNWGGRRSPRLDDDHWWVDDPSLLWRIGYRSGVQFAGLWRFCREVGARLPDGCIVEIGTMLGDGAATVAAAFPDRRIVTVDPGPTAEVQAAAAERLAWWPNVDRWVCTSAEAAMRVARDAIPVAMVYLDGDHSEVGVRQDIEAWRRLLVPGGCLAGHDYADSAWPGVTAAVCALLGPPARYPDSTWVCFLPTMEDGNAVPVT
jgi:hypothetical protein